MTKAEVVSRISNQLRMLNVDDYISDRFVLSVAESHAIKFLTQASKRRSLDRNQFLYRELGCIEFEKVDIFSCKYVEFKSCKKLSRSKKPIDKLGLIYTRYGSSIKEIHSIDRTSKVYTESTLYQLRLDKDRAPDRDPDVFYILDNYIYKPDHVKAVSALVMGMDQYELDQMCECKNECKSAWEYDFICPDSLLEDVIAYSVQNILQTKQIPENETSNLNSQQ